MPGDLVFTGMPAGVRNRRTPPRFLQPGETLVSRVEGIGEIRQNLPLVRHYIRPDLGNRRLDKLSVRDVQSWLGHLRTDSSAAPRVRTSPASDPAAAPPAAAADRSRPLEPCATPG
jgi:hypothetical protein